MKRPLVLIAIFHSLGIFTARFQEATTLLFVWGLFVAVGVHCYRCLRLGERCKENSLFVWKNFTQAVVKGRIGILWSVSFYILGFLAFTYLDKAYNEAFVNIHQTDFQARGIVLAPAEKRADDTRYRILLTNNQDAMFKKRVLLSVRNDTGDIFSYGDEVLFKGKIQKPQGIRNPGGFDYAFYLKTQRISATVYADGNNVERIETRQGNAVIDFGYRCREFIIEKLKAMLPEQTAGVLSGILLGHKELLTSEEKEAFRNAGLSHFMAVSGAHVAFFLFPIALILNQIGIQRRWMHVLLILFLFFFVLITGFVPSVLRASLMTSIFLFARVLKRESDAWNAISFALVVLLLFNPFYLFQIGFLLSFSATISILFLFPRLKRWLQKYPLPTYLQDLIAVTLSAQIGVFPWMVIFFHQVQWASLFSNLFIFPLIGVIHFLGTAFVLVVSVFPNQGEIIASLLHLLTSFVLLVTKWFSEIDGFVLKTSNSIFLKLGILWFVIGSLKKCQRRYRFVWASSLLIIFFGIWFWRILFAPVEVLFFDVGQGDSTLIQTPAGRTILIDGGGYTGKKSSDMGERVLIPYLEYRGITKIDYVVSTHQDADHIAGLVPVLEKYDVSYFLYPKLTSGYALVEGLQKKGVITKALQEGDSVHIDKTLFFDVYNPKGLLEDTNMNENVQNTIKQDDNDHSLVLKLDVKGWQFLFSADISKEIEERLLLDYPNLNIDVLKVAHHGSATSSSEVFLKSLRPKISVIQVGANNRYGHPDQEVLQRLRQYSDRVYRTDVQGAIIMRISKDEINLKSMQK